MLNSAQTQQGYLSLCPLVAVHPWQFLFSSHGTNDDGRTLQAMFSEDHTCTDQEETARWSLILRDSTWLSHREGACPRYDQEMLSINPQGSVSAHS